MSPHLPKRVLVICTHNAVRSQMAEAFFLVQAPDRFNVHSAGTNPIRVDPRTVQVMREVGVDISSAMSKSLDEFVRQRFDYVITVCSDADRTCPGFPGPVEISHWDLPDPASVHGKPEDQIAVFRQVRDRIRDLVADFIKTHSPG